LGANQNYSTVFICQRFVGLTLPDTRPLCKQESHERDVHCLVAVFWIPFRNSRGATMDVLITGAAGNLGRVSYYGDTSRFRRELLPRLVYRSIQDGVADMEAYRPSTIGRIRLNQTTFSVSCQSGN
jgi:hypothetical protein